ncbi:hypothetical protein JK386_06580 [Nocardioides sp. zg-536]|uniref:Uncharacterized protein n=1 Tax=Nocardioides faecalis TaxID=2803858 RepID=A0A938Y5F9_9ACTN|nr:hypothetical protein [Nocardioides faecalis]MBM9459562.1 hypothetical protein [Nocardioides faecalis]MBS4753658.1 hypothetical protein [Nocardioides faecalis]QVI58094.1 hypothetical protein KG111_13875 [Nocardioides faecalis]
MRGIFFEEEHARAAALALVRGGYEAEVLRERLAGEDDDADHPWAVLTDAPEIQLDMLVEMYDGWLDYDDAPDAPDAADAPAPPAPTRAGFVLPLPSEPRRIKRPGS